MILNKKISNNILYIKNAFVLFLDSISKLMIGFVFSILIARYFGPSKFGQINYVFAYIYILQVFVLFGFDEIVLQDLGLGLCPEINIIGTVICGRFIFALPVYLIGFILFYLLTEQILTYIYIILGLQLFSYSFAILKQWFQIKSLNKYTVIASQISLLSVTIGKLLFILFFDSVLIYSIILTVGIFIESLILLFFYLNIGNVSLGKFDFLYFKHLIKASLPLLLSGISIVVFMKISQIMVGTFLSKQSLGVYSVAATISELIFFVPHCVTSAVYPKIVKAKKENTGYEKLIAKTGSFNIFLCVLFALFCTFLAPFLIEKLYGEAYREAKGVVQIYGWVGVFMALGNSHSCYLVFENIQKYSLYSIVSSLIINIFLGYFFIKHFGINGAAVSFLISQIFGNYLCYGFFKDKRSFFLRTKSLLFNYGSI